MRCCLCHNEIVNGFAPITRGFINHVENICSPCFTGLLKTNVPIITMEDNTDHLYKTFMEAVQLDQQHR